jgi:gamma-glutamylcyclotransferase (GGCT)/AIG2-like uncharacterized protein YtfP
MEKQMPVFAYGTLMIGRENYKRYIHPFPHRAIPAETEGELYHLPLGYPGLLAGQTSVRGVCFFFPEEVYEQVLTGLDELEGYFGPGDPRNEYERVLMPVRLDGGEQIQAYVYQFVDAAYARRKGIRVEDGDWHGFMQRRQRE